MEAYICKGRLTDNLNHVFLMVMSLCGTVNCFCRIILYKVKPSVRVLDLDPRRRVNYVTFARLVLEMSVKR